MSRSRIGAAIEELASIGAITTRAGGAVADATWTARPHAEVISGLHGVRFGGPADGTGRRREALAATAAVLPEPVTLGEGLRHLTTRALTRERLAELNAVTRHEHLAMNPEEAFDAGSVRAAVPLQRRLLDRGARMRVLGVQPPARKPSSRYGLAPDEKRPAYRQALAVPMKLFVVDRKVALFPVDPGDYERGYLEVSQPTVVAALAALFERQWASAWDPREDAMAETTLSARERALVVLLAQGHTDITAARELGISARSVSTLIRQMMDRFEVDNRFQLGLALGTLRAVRPPSRHADRNNDDQT
jgi:DNA-binding CsgD family transcriptional regulator